MFKEVMYGVTETIAVGHFEVTQKYPVLQHTKFFWKSV